MATIVLLLLCLSVHACIARHLGIINKEFGREVHLSGKGVEKARLDMTSIPSNVNPTMLDELRTQQQMENGESTMDESRIGASMNKPKDSKALLKEEEDTKGTISGTEIVVTSSQVGLRQATKIEGLERRARSVLGSGSHVIEGTFNSKENDVVEDVVVMDYEQPHRKPPIHNKEP